MWGAVLRESLTVTSFVFIIMVVVDFVDVFSQQRLTSFLQGGRWRQYLLAAFLGATPGCLGAFMVVSLYIHGRLSMGALIGCMVATSGDEAFVILAKIPQVAMWLTVLLFVLGLIAAWLADIFLNTFHITPSIQCCPVQTFHPEKVEPVFTLTSLKKNFGFLSFHRFLLLLLVIFTLSLFLAGRIGPPHWNWVRVTFTLLLFLSLGITIFASEHYLEEHIWDHLIQKHLWRIFLWTFGALLFIKIGLTYWHLKAFVKQHLAWVLLTSALVGIIPESGPHLIFVFLFIQEIIPFSVLLTSSIVQDGHGMLPLFSASLKDSLWVKLFNFCLGLAIGGSLYLLGF
ncbi:MAG: arsenic efflux protein [Candidatus Desulfofervidaceae bacterium]|nr:arsenic efflux protein [Candidatus Desulfofervidaceae bacterium]